MNVWLEPRSTADIDLTVQVDPQGLAQIRESLSRLGLETEKEFGADQASGPDFVRLVDQENSITIEIQLVKTEFQSQVIERAKDFGGVKVSTPEDLIVMKLIADRPKDRIDLLGLVGLPDLNWEYIEHWVVEWQVSDRLARVRQAP